MEFSYVIYAAVAFFFLFYLWSSAKPKIGTGTPPEAGGARPFTGHLHLMSGGSAAKLPHINLATLADAYGPVFTIRLGVQRALVVSSSELVKELFTTYDAAISTRAPLRTTRHLSYNFAMFGFSPYGAYWREVRKLVNVEILSARRIELQRDVRVSETSQAVNGLYKLWEKRRDGSGRVLVDMKERLADLSFNVIFRTVAGKRFSGGDEAEDRLHHQLMRDLFHLAGTFVPADAFPFLAWMDLGGHEKRSKETADKLDEMLGGWVAEHREKENSGGDGPRDFMDLMLSVKLGENLQGQYDADTIIKSTCLSLLLGGSDTTTVMLVWALSLMLNNRRVLRKAQEEVDTQVGKERRVKESDVNNLVYLQAIVKETLRLYPAGRGAHGSGTAGSRFRTGGSVRKF